MLIKNMILNLVTPCSRIENLKQIEDSIEQITNMDVIWHICFDSKDMPNIDTININHQLYNIKSFGIYEVSGNIQRNLILNNIKDGFIFFLDDDNIIHPNLNNILKDVVYGENYMFSQIYKNGNIRFKSNVKCLYPGLMDSAQMLVSSSSLTNTSIWPPQIRLAEAYFAMSIHRNKKFQFIDEIGSYYNYLR